MDFKLCFLLTSNISQIAKIANGRYYYLANFAIILYLPGNGSNPWYSSWKPALVELPSDSKCSKILLVEDTWLFGMLLPQYLPIIGAEFESPSYTIKVS